MRREPDTAKMAELVFTSGNQSKAAASSKNGNKYECIHAASLTEPGTATRGHPSLHQGHLGGHAEVKSHITSHILIRHRTRAQAEEALHHAGIEDATGMAAEAHIDQGRTSLEVLRVMVV